MKSYIKQIFVFAVVVICSVLLLGGQQIQAATKIQWNTGKEYSSNVDDVKYTYEISKDEKYARITKVTSSGGGPNELVVPESIEGYKVTAFGVIESGNYKSCVESLIKTKKIVLPNSLTVIGQYAFASMVSLKSIEIPNGVKTIGKGAFSSTGLTSVVIPDTVTTIGSYAFHFCTSLKTVTLSSKITEIKSNTFSICFALEKINLEKVTTFGKWAFWSCESLKSIKFNSKIKELGDFSFTSAGWASSKKNYAIINGKYLIRYNGSKKKVSIPKGITKIEAEAFIYSKAISVEIPSSVTYIGPGAFYGSNVKNIYFAGNAPKIALSGDAEALDFYRTYVFEYLDKCQVYYKKGKTGFTAKIWKKTKPKLYTTFK